MGLRDLLYETWISLIANKARTILTALGIVIGIASVIAMTSLITGVQVTLMGELGMKQARIVYLSSYEEPITDNDVRLIELLFPEYETIAQLSYNYAEVPADVYANGGIGVTGISESYFDIMDTKVAEGRLISQDEIARDARVIMLGKGLVKDIYGSEDASVIGEKISLGRNGDDFTIVGVLEGDYVSRDYMQSYAPHSALEESRIVQEEYAASEYIALAAEGSDANDLAERTQTFLQDRKGEMASAYSMKSMIDQVNTVMTGFAIMLTAIASISLFVGGIGIMNMMLTNVTERTREIGLRKSLGAHTGDIVLQFLGESIALCLVGGFFGIVFGYLGAFGLAAIANNFAAVSQQLGGQVMPVIGIESIAIAVGVCTFIGIVFGFYPARRAAKLDPVDSLRYQ